MTTSEILYRVATDADLSAITRVRTSVTENHLTVTEMAQRGITEAAVAASFRGRSRGWVAQHHAHIVAFSIADRESRSIFALFVRPGSDGRGIGSQLLNLAVEWLWDSGTQRIWLTTRQGTKAANFYQRRGWVATAADASGSIRYELARPSGRTAE